MSIGMLCNNYNEPLKITIESSFTGVLKISCQSGKITNTQGHRNEYRNRCRAICSDTKAGKSIGGKDGALGSLIKQLTEAALAAEINSHLTQDLSNNRKNGYATKTMKSEHGEFQFDIPRDRNSSFEPEIVKKNQRTMTGEIEERILSLYTLGNSYTQISSTIENIYGIGFSKWGKKYPIVFTSWRNKWDNLSVYFKYPADIRKVIYTTNIIESVHSQFKTLTKTKGAFPKDNSLLKLLFMGIQNTSKKMDNAYQKLEFNYLSTLNLL